MERRVGEPRLQVRVAREPGPAGGAVATHVVVIHVPANHDGVKLQRNPTDVIDAKGDWHGEWPD